jgi:hypothetical protein
MEVRAVKRVVAASAACLPAAAWACPMCAERGDPNRLATFALLAGLLAVPYALGLVVVRIVRKLEAS